MEVTAFGFVFKGGRDGSHNALVRPNLRIRTSILSGQRSVYLCDSETRSPDQKPTCKDPERNDQKPVITFRPTYTPVSNRSGSRSC